MVTNNGSGCGGGVLRQPALGTTGLIALLIPPPRKLVSLSCPLRTELEQRGAAHYALRERVVWSEDAAFWRPPVLLVQPTPDQHRCRRSCLEDHHGHGGRQVEDLLGGVSIHGLAGPIPIAAVNGYAC
jgi:hypothetical protein